MQDLEDTFIVILKYTNYFNQRTPIFKKCIESLITTTENTGCKIILIDNGENDDEEYCLNLLHANKIHSYVRLHNIGLEAFNIGFEIGLQLINNAKFVVYTGDDLLFKEKWLEECVEILNTYPDKKIIATPVHSACHLKQKKYRAGTLPDGRLLNKRAGANCRVYRVKDLQKIGKFNRRNPKDAFFKNGVEITIRFNKLGYVSALTKCPKAKDLCRRTARHAYPSPRGGHIVKLLKDEGIEPKTGLSISFDRQKVCGKVVCGEISSYILYKFKDLFLYCTKANKKYLALTTKLYNNRFELVADEGIVNKKFDFIFLDVCEKETLEKLKANVHFFESKINPGGLLLCFMGLHRKKFLNKKFVKQIDPEFKISGAFFWKKI